MKYFEKQSETKLLPEKTRTSYLLPKFNVTRSNAALAGLGLVAGGGVGDAVSEGPLGPIIGAVAGGTGGYFASKYKPVAAVTETGIDKIKSFATGLLKKVKK